MRLRMEWLAAGLALTVSVSAVVAATAASVDWPRYRGPDGDGISRETGLLQGLARERPAGDLASAARHRLLGHGGGGRPALHALRRGRERARRRLRRRQRQGALAHAPRARPSRRAGRRAPGDAGRRRRPGLRGRRREQARGPGGRDRQGPLEHRPGGEVRRPGAAVGRFQLAGRRRRPAAGQRRRRRQPLPARPGQADGEAGLGRGVRQRRLLDAAGPRHRGHPAGDLLRRLLADLGVAAGRQAVLERAVEHPVRRQRGDAGLRRRPTRSSSPRATTRAPSSSAFLRAAASRRSNRCGGTG